MTHTRVFLKIAIGSSILSHKNPMYLQRLHLAKMRLNLLHLSVDLFTNGQIGRIAVYRVGERLFRGDVLVSNIAHRPHWVNWRKHQNQLIPAKIFADVDSGRRRYSNQHHYAAGSEWR